MHILADKTVEPLGGFLCETMGITAYSMQYSIQLIRSLHKIASLIESTMDPSFDDGDEIKRVYSASFAHQRGVKSDFQFA